ncbi:YolD-like family protein [Streptococcus pluranimalium]|uniref:hypothetical protein n=1 Tax=Streptococcus pluranimalium TaxID=82348 RepID=UPI0039E8921B
MVDRSYLPFASARNYQDAGMQKWSGFFLSEHSSSLSQAKSKKEWQSSLTHSETLRLIMQLYSSQNLATITYHDNHKSYHYTGRVSSLDNQSFLLKEDDHYRKLNIEQIINIIVKKE